MTIDNTLCTAIEQGNASYHSYIGQAIHVAAGPLVDPLPDSEATAVLRLEIIHTDATCQTPLADACVHVASQDDDIRFVAQEAAAADNYVSVWHREAPPTADESGWTVLGAGQKSQTSEVLLLGQTLNSVIVIAPEHGSGAGYLQHETDRPTDGWTVSVGLYHPGGREQLSGQRFIVDVTSRPYQTSTTAPQMVTLT